MIADLMPYPTYKDSGVPWVGEVPEHWRLPPNRSLLRPRKTLVGHRHTEYRLLSLTKEGIIVRNVESGKGKFSADMGTFQEVHDGDLVFCLFDVPETPRTVGLSHHDGMITGAYTVFECSNSILSVFLDIFYHAMDDRKLLSPLYSGLRNTIPLPHFLAAKTPLPPPVEQAAIVRFLEHADSRIRRYIQAKQKLISLLNEQKQAIIHQAVTKGLDPKVKMKPSGVEWLGEVPEHWEILSLGIATESIQTGPFGSQLHANEYVSHGVPVVNPSHMRGGRIQADPTVTVDEVKAQELARHVLQAGDIVAARRGELGRCALVGESETGWLCGTGSLRIRPNSLMLLPTYLLAIFGSKGVKDTLSLTSIGATMENLNAGMVTRLRFPRPPLEEQKQILSFITAESESIKEIAEIARQEIELLREYRTRLVADVVTGKLDVREAAANLPDEIDHVDDLPDIEALDEAGESLDDLDNVEEAISAD